MVRPCRENGWNSTPSTDPFQWIANWKTSSWTSTHPLQRPTQTDALEDQHRRQNLGNHRPGPSLTEEDNPWGIWSFRENAKRRGWRETTTSKSQSRLTTCTGYHLLRSTSPSFPGAYRSHQPQTSFPPFVNQGVVWSSETRSCRRRRRMIVV